MKEDTRTIIRRLYQADCRSRGAHKRAVLDGKKIDLVTEQRDWHTAECLATLLSDGAVDRLRTIDGEHAQMLWFVLQHSPSLALQKKGLALIWKLSPAPFQPWHHAHLADLIRVRQGKPQVYGTQMTLARHTETWHYHPLLWPSLVNELRRARGLTKLDLSPSNII